MRLSAGRLALVWARKQGVAAQVDLDDILCFAFTDIKRVALEPKRRLFIHDEPASQAELESDTLAALYGGY